MATNTNEYHRQYYARNRDKIKAHKRAWRKANPEKLARIHTNQHYKQTYGITLTEFEAIAKAQDSKCAICKRVARLVLDHNHLTGEIRAALCSPCNRGIGQLGDSTDRIMAAADYLRSYDKTQGTANGH